jgi:hypothetical protein
MPKKKKETYSAHEVKQIHHWYRLGIGLGLVGFLWLLHHYGVSDEFLYDFSGGQIKIKKGLSFWGILLVYGKWLGTFGGLVFTLIMLYRNILKKKKG